MEPVDLEARVKKLQQQVTETRRILRSLATKKELRALRDEVRRCATKEDLKRCATKEDLKRFATKEDLDRYATKEDLLAEGERTRRHFDIVSERMHDEIRLIAEGQLGTEVKLDRERLQRLVLERRVTVLEDRMGAAPAPN